MSKGNSLTICVRSVCKRIYLSRNPGTKRSVGYPDIALTIEERPYYIEVKTYNERTARSTMRTFYLSPSKDPKVARDAAHMLIAFELEEPQPANSEHAMYACSIYTNWSVS